MSGILEVDPSDDYNVLSECQIIPTWASIPERGKSKTV